MHKTVLFFLLILSTLTACKGNVSTVDAIDPEWPVFAHTGYDADVISLELLNETDDRETRIDRSTLVMQPGEWRTLGWSIVGTGCFRIYIESHADLEFGNMGDMERQFGLRHTSDGSWVTFTNKNRCTFDIASADDPNRPLLYLSVRNAGTKDIHVKVKSKIDSSIF